jgi:hypothetical protein
MKLAYGSSIAGVSHLKRKRPCQDAFFIAHTDFAMIAAVCDGVGSQKHSGMASAVASEACVKHCLANLKPGMDDNSILAVICHAFEAALDAVEKEARAQNLDIWQCDTTMTLGVLANGDLYYGQSGDSGMIALFSDGSYSSVTQQQNDSSGRVYPLRMNSSWAYDKVEGKVASALLCTDGILKLLNAGGPERIFFRLNYYLDPRAIFLRSTQGARSDALGKWIEAELKRINAEEAHAANYDDLTIVVMHDTNVRVELSQPASQIPKVPEIILPAAALSGARAPDPNQLLRMPAPALPQVKSNPGKAWDPASEKTIDPEKLASAAGGKTIDPEKLASAAGGKTIDPEKLASAAGGKTKGPEKLADAGATVDPDNMAGIQGEKTIQPETPIIAGSPPKKACKLKFKLPKIIKRTDA